MTDLTLFGHPDSGHACKVALALSLAELPHESVWVDIWAPREARPAAFQAASTLGEVPLLLIDGAAHIQSGAILLEIATRFQTLGGETPEGLRRAREVLMWEANRIGMCVPQLIEAHQRGGGMAADVVTWLKARFNVDKENFARLLGDAPFLHGAAPGIGDCAVWGYTQWLGKAGLEPNDALESWLARMRALPGVKMPEAFFPASA